MQPKSDLGLEIYVDVDFAVNWDPAKTEDIDTAQSRHGFVIYYARCSIAWKSSMQTEIALSTTEAEYVGILYALHSAIPVMRLPREMKKQGIDAIVDRAPMRCKVFEDNASAIEIARNERFCPRTENMNIKLHLFRSYVTKGKITIVKIKSEEQPADLFTKPLPNPLFEYICCKIMGW